MLQQQPTTLASLSTVMDVLWDEPRDGSPFFCIEGFKGEVLSGRIIYLNKLCEDIPALSFNVNPLKGIREVIVMTYTQSVFSPIFFSLADLTEALSCTKASALQCTAYQVTQ